MGLTIDGPKLQELLGVPVLPLVASKGRGVRPLFTTVLHVAKETRIPIRPVYSPDLEDAIQAVKNSLSSIELPLPEIPLAIKLLEGDQEFVRLVQESSPSVIPVLQAQKHILNQSHGQQAEWIFQSERNKLAANLTTLVVTQGERRMIFRDRLDDILLHPILGYLALVTIVYLFFQLVYSFGSALEKPLMAVFDRSTIRLLDIIGSQTLLAQMLTGLLQGISGGIAIVLPYLTPFLFGLGLLEDVGYLPRVAFLMDALMHRLGLHGKAIVPFILGYGCNVPAVMSTRMLEEKRDRFLAAALATLVPCAARLAVVFGLVAFYLGPWLALAIYLYNLLVIALTGKIISQLLPEESPGLILEMPVYRVPTLRTVTSKAWFRVREFIVDAWPILILGSLVLALANYFNLSRFINTLVRPLTWMLNLPALSGVPLIFGILRKELSLVMLRQSLNVTDFSSALTPVQMVTFAVFVVFYIPCLATLAVLRRELGGRNMLRIAGLTVLIATLAALLARGVAFIFLNHVKF